MKLTILLLGIAVLLPAQAPSPTAEEASKKLGIVEGKVFNSVIGQPLASAAINLSPHFTTNGVDSYATTTDIEGHFLFRDVTPGLYNLTAAKEGFARQVWGSRGKTLLGASISVQAGGHLSDLSFNLLRLGVLHGRVTDEEGKPVRRIVIEVLRYGYLMPNGTVIGKRRLLGAGGATTNESGEFQVPDLPPNTYFVRADLPLKPGAPPPADPDKPDEGYATTYYPNAPDAAGAVGIRVEPGVDLPGIDLRFHKIPLYRIKGRVIDDLTGKPLGDRVLMLGPEGGLATTITKADGEQAEFEIAGLAPGSYTLTADLGGSVELPFSQSIQVMERNVEGLVIRLPRAIEMSGTLRTVDPDQHPMALGNIMVTMAPVDEHGAMLATTDQAGAFRLKNLMPGRYNLYLRGIPQNAYVKSIVVDQQEVPENEVNLAAGSDVTITLSPSGAQFDAIVRDSKGKPMTGASVSLVPQGWQKDHSGNRHYSINSDQDGKVHFQGIAPGEYKIFVWEDHEPGEPQDPEFRKPFESRAVPVKFTENGHESMQLQPILVDEIARAREQR